MEYRERRKNREENGGIKKGGTGNNVAPESYSRNYLE